jgi:hypothetical protein
MRLANAGVGIAAIVFAATAEARPPRAAPLPVISVTAAQLEQRAAARNLAGLLGALPCDPRAVPTLVRPAGATPTTPGSLTCLNPVDFRMVEVYRAHNEARHRFGSQPLVWDPRLAVQAQAYAVHLSRTGRLVHSPRAGRGNARENLTRGLPGWTGRQLVGIWLDERRYFRPGVFPHVTTTGRWEDVSHYTQVVWPTTVTLGCGIADGSGYRWMVCHYAPGGNRDGIVVSPTSNLAGRQ